MRIYANSGQFIPKNTSSKLLNTGPGKVYGVILSVDTVAHADASLTLYDNTAASGTVLSVFNAHHYAPVIILFDKLLPLTFATGLCAVTTAYGDAFVIMEA